MKKQTKAKAIKEFCFECSGDSAKEVTLCVCPGCPLWPYRTGNHLTSTVYKKRMATAAVNYAEEVTDIRKDPALAPFFPTPSSKKPHGASKDA